MALKVSVHCTFEEASNCRRFLIGGGQERGRRAGTEATHQIAGMGAAAEFVKDMAPMEKISGTARPSGNRNSEQCPKFTSERHERHGKTPAEYVQHLF